MNTVVFVILWAVIALNFIVAAMNLIILRKSIMLHGLLMDICLRAWALRQFPGALVKITLFDDDGDVKAAARLGGSAPSKPAPGAAKPPAP